MLPSDYGYPTIENPATIRAAAALPAAGAWEAAPTELASAGYLWATFYITYTRGAAGGAVDTQLQFSPYAADLAGVEDWFTQSLYDAGVLAAGTDVTSNIQRELITYTSTAAGAGSGLPWKSITSRPTSRQRPISRVRVA